MAPSFVSLTNSSPESHIHSTLKQSLVPEPVTNGHETRPTQGPDSPLPPVSDIDSTAYASQEALLVDIIESMRRSGGCVIRKLVDAEALKEVEGEVRPWLDKAQPWNGGSTFGSLVVRWLKLLLHSSCYPPIF